MLTDFPRITLQAGEFAYREGDEADRSFLLLTGGIEIHRGEAGSSPLVQQIRPGRMFGVVDVISERKRVNNARSTKESKLILIPNDYINTTMDETDAFLQAIMRISVQRISQLYPELW